MKDAAIDLIYGKHYLIGADRKTVLWGPCPGTSCGSFGCREAHDAARRILGHDVKRECLACFYDGPASRLPGAPV